MKVDNPKFNAYSPPGSVKCIECPFTDESGVQRSDIQSHELCNGWGVDHSVCCPTKETYLEACLLADLAKKRKR